MNIKQAPPSHFLDLADFLGTVRQSYDNMPRRLKELASYSFDHPENMALNSITELAQNIGVPPSTLVRYAKYFGFSGFSELQKLYRDQMRSLSYGYSNRLDHIDHIQPENILNEINKSSINSIQNLEKTIDHQALTKSISLIANAKNIWLVGAGRTQAVQRYFHYLFTGLGMVSHAVEQNPDQVERYVQLMTPDDVVIATSFHPYNQNTVRIVDAANKSDIPCICLTDHSVNALHGTVKLIYAEDQFSGFRTLSATMNLALYLAIESGRQRFDKPKNK